MIMHLKFMRFLRSMMASAMLISLSRLISMLISMLISLLKAKDIESPCNSKGLKKSAKEK